MSQFDRIMRDPEIMGGKPCIRGMRVTTGTLVGLIAAGRSAADILDAYPYLEQEDNPAGISLRSMAGRGDRGATTGCAKILVDMNLSPTWVPFLNQNGFPAEHWSTVGAASARDMETMEYAAANDFVVFTHDLDFGALLASSRVSGPSVVQIRAQDLLPDTIGPLVLKSLREVLVHPETGALVTIEPGRNRIRILPI
jgi:predicted nuclease of predicted toxin-antitoxin system/uncharacterized protein (DUF433 family)